ncbi:hypothetical protein TNCV_675381 [Trichonephila clavipes]|nr:hypothetical protein TNCV_675381 [Trichonephila clavipes]
MFNHNRSYGDFIVLFLYKWKNNHKAAAAFRNINAAFGDSSVNERTIPCWYAKYESGEESLTNENRSRFETVVVNEVLRGIPEVRRVSQTKTGADSCGQRSPTRDLGGEESLTNKIRGRFETVVVNEVLRGISEVRRVSQTKTGAGLRQLWSTKSYEGSRQYC